MRLANLPGETPVERSIDLDVPSVRLLAAPSRAISVEVKVSLSGGELLGEETAVGTDANAVLLEVSSLELDTGRVAVSEPAADESAETPLLVDRVLGLSISGAERRIERTGEGLLAHAVWLLVVKLSATVLGLAALGRCRRSSRLLVVTVGSNNDDLETSLVLTDVGGSLGLDLLSPDGALDLSNGGGLARALVWVPLGVTLDEDVEASAGGSGVAVGRALGRVVAGQDLVAEISASLDGTTQVGEGLIIA